MEIEIASGVLKEKMILLIIEEFKKRESDSIFWVKENNNPEFRILITQEKEFQNEETADRQPLLFSFENEEYYFFVLD